MKHLNFLLFSIITFQLLSINVNSVPATKNPSSYAIGIPDLQTPYHQYIKSSRRKILKSIQEKEAMDNYVGPYTIEDVVDMRSPFQLPEKESEYCFEDKSRGGGKGFILSHGLTDSPFFMKDIAHVIHQHYPCSLVRAILLPGHGTVAGDALNLNFNDWIKTIEYGVYRLDSNKNIDEIYLVGFSTGSSLAINQLVHGNYNSKVAGLMLFSLALSAKSKLAPLAPFVNAFIDWQSNYPEDDASRYASFTFEAASEFYKFTKNMNSKKYAIDLPTLVVVSADDQTIDPNIAEYYFCNYIHTNQKALIWYESLKQEKNHLRLCSRWTHSVSLPNTNSPLHIATKPFYFANFAHTSLTFKPDNFHYGAFGNYHKCKHLLKSKEIYSNCLAGTGNFVFGEFKTIDPKRDLNKQFDYVRASTFNPDFSRIEIAVKCFVNSSCRKNKLLKSISSIPPL